MRLSLAIHPVTDVRLGAATRLAGTVLTVDQEELRGLLLADDRLQAAAIEVVAPGESCRFGTVFDIVEPRAKLPGDGADFPGILGPLTLAGRGTTHVLRGAAVTILEQESAGRIVDMSGDAGAASPYAALHHLVVVPQPRPGLERHTVANALRLASAKAAVYLARAAVDLAPATIEEFETGGPSQAGREGLPRFAYIGQIHSRQMVAEVDEQIFYGHNTNGMVPVILHPNEWLDGAIVPSYFNMGLETYAYQNHPIILELYRWHQQGKISFVGTIATTAGSDNVDRERDCMIAAEQAKWNLAADGVVLTKCGGGAPHADMALTARRCEELGMRTVVQVNGMSGDGSAESALLFNYAEVDAIVYVGGRGVQWPAAPVERVVAAGPAAATALAALHAIPSARVCGVNNQQGLARIRSFVD